MLEAMRALLRRRIQDAFFTPSAHLGVEVNIESLPGGAFIEWKHLHLVVPQKYVTSRVAEKKAEWRDNSALFARGLGELSQEAVQTAIELIDEGIVYRGAEFRPLLTEFLARQQKYGELSASRQDAFVWAWGAGSVAKVKNLAIGTLLTDLTAGVAVDEALRRWKSVMDPTKYLRPNPVVTEQSLQKAEEVIRAEGLEPSLYRRFAHIDDISVRDVLWANCDAVRGEKLGVFAQLRDDLLIDAQTFRNVRTMVVDDFVAFIRANATKLEILFQPAHTGNLVSLIAPQDFQARPLFKWRNPFSLAYKGNAADSIRETVRQAGGYVEGFMRGSFRWNTGEHNPSDYDLHCQTPQASKGHIYYGYKRAGGGELDIDITHPSAGRPAVENIYWLNREAVAPGRYQFWVENYHLRSHTVYGFEAEIEVDGKIYQFDYPHFIAQKERVDLATVVVDKSGGVTITPHLPYRNAATKSETVWGIGTNQFHPVSAVMFSPNHWEGEAGIGHRHLVFMVNGCVADTQPYGFYNEYLHHDLNPHRRVLEAVGNRLRVAPSDSQLSGLGFSTTRDAVYCRLNGRDIVKVIF
jgi:hypothetical protein